MPKLDNETERQWFARVAGFEDKDGEIWKVRCWFTEDYSRTLTIMTDHTNGNPQTDFLVSFNRFCRRSDLAWVQYCWYLRFSNDKSQENQILKSFCKDMASIKDDSFSEAEKLDEHSIKDVSDLIYLIENDVFATVSDQDIMTTPRTIPGTPTYYASVPEFPWTEETDPNIFLMSRLHSLD